MLWQDGFFAPETASQTIDWENQSEESDPDSGQVPQGDQNYKTSPRESSLTTCTKDLQYPEYLSITADHESVNLPWRTPPMVRSNSTFKRQFVMLDSSDYIEQNLGETTTSELPSSPTQPASPLSPLISCKKKVIAPDYLETSPIISKAPDYLETSPIISKTPCVTPMYRSPFIQSSRRGRDSVGKRKLLEFLEEEYISSSLEDEDEAGRTPMRRLVWSAEAAKDSLARVPSPPTTPRSQQIDSDEEFQGNQALPAQKNINTIGLKALLEEETSELSGSIISIGSELYSIPWKGTPVPLLSQSSLSSEERSLAEYAATSGRKRKPVKRGLAARLERTLKMRESMKSIHTHQLRLLNRRPDHFKDLRVTAVAVESSVVCIQGTDEVGASWTVQTNVEFCRSSLDAGYKIRLLPPWTHLLIQDRNVLTGITEWENIDAPATCSQSKQENIYAPVICSQSKQENIDAPAPCSQSKRSLILNHRTEWIIGSSVSQLSLDVNEDNVQTGGIDHVYPPGDAGDAPLQVTSKQHGVETYDLRCECQKLEGEESFCEHPSTYPVLAEYNRQKSSIPTRKAECAPPPPAYMQGRRVGSVVELVERFGGCSSSPQPLNSGQRAEATILVLRILQPFRRVRHIGDPSLPRPLTELETCFLAEDEQKNFVLVKLDSDLHKDPREWRVMLDGGWTELIGATVKLCGLFPQNRTVASRSSRLVRLVSALGTRPVSALGTANQRFYYTLKVYTSSRMKILEFPVPPTILPSLRSSLAVERRPGERLNLRCVVAHKDEASNSIYVHDCVESGVPSFPLHRIQYTKEACVPSCDDTPGLVNLFGLSVEVTGLVLDHYSGCLLLQSRVEFPYRDVVPPYSGAEVPYRDVVPPYSEAEVPYRDVVPPYSGAEVQFPYCDVVPPYSGAEVQRHGELVRLQGKVSSLDLSECVQWLSCRECGGDRILNLEGRECDRCHSTDIRNHLKMVLSVCGVWVQLTESSAMRLLTKPSGPPGRLEKNQPGLSNPGPGDRLGGLNHRFDLEQVDPGTGGLGELYDQDQLDPHAVLGTTLDLVCVVAQPFFKQINT